MANLPTSSSTSVSLEGMRRGVLYLTPLLLLAPFFSWTLEAGQLGQSAVYQSDSDELSMVSPQLTQLPQMPDAEFVTATKTSTKITPWLTAYNRANEYISAHLSTLASIKHEHSHNPEQWQFARSLPMKNASLLESATDASLPTVNPVAPLSFFAPPTDNKLRTIMLDPGHGGSDPGTVGSQGLLEKHLTLDIAKRVQLLLAAHPNMNVLLTRQDDKGYSRNVRMQKVQATQPDILISLHLNNLPQKNLTLVESFYASQKNILESELGRNTPQSSIAKRSRAAGYPFVKDSRRLASLLQGHLFHQVSQNDDSAINAGTKEDTLFMLTRSYLPATLIELTCLSNSEEEQRLKTPEYRQDIAIALAKGILDYFATQNSVVKS